MKHIKILNNALKILFFSLNSIAQTSSLQHLEQQWQPWLQKLDATVKRLEHCIVIDKKLINELNVKAKKILQQRHQLNKQMEEYPKSQYEQQWQQLDNEWAAWGKEFSESVEQLEHCTITDRLLKDLDVKRKQLIQERKHFLNKILKK